MRRLTALALATLCALAPLSAARAHEELSLHALTVLGSVEPHLPGVELRVVHLGAPALALRNRSDEAVTVLDDRGRPFLRVGPKGVFANVRSPMAYKSVDPSSDAFPKDLRGGVRWARIARGSSWTWFDPRLRFDEGERSWRVELRSGATSSVASGGFEPLEAHGHFRTHIDVPEVEGLEVRIADGPVPALFVRNESPQTLHVDGADGEPLLRIAPNGVFANVRSPGYYTGALQTIRRVPAKADASAPPRWMKVSAAPVWGWLEHRAAAPATLLQRERLGARPHPVLEWTSPMRLGDRSVDVAGTVEWVPSHHASAPVSSDRPQPTYWWLVAIVLMTGGAFALRGRRLVTP